MILLSSSPNATAGGITSDVSGSISQLPYLFSREDFEIDAQADDGGDAQIHIEAAEGDVSSQFSIGDRVYYSPDSATYEKKVYTVKAVTFSTKTKITLDLAFDPTTPDGFINLLSRISYNIELHFYESTGTNLLFDDIIRLSTPADGIPFADMKGPINSYMDQNDLLEIIYQIKYREAYTGLTPPALVAADNVHAIKAMKPILHEGGSNLWDHLLDSSISKFLTKFENPVLWDGWKRTISYVIDSGYTARVTNAPHSLFRYLDQNRVFISNSDDATASASTGLFVRNLVVAAIPDTAFFVDATMTDDVTAAARTETLQFQILQECKNPICIEWLNSLGHYEQHLFEMNQEFIDDVEDQDSYRIPITDKISAAIKTIGKRRSAYTQMISMADQDLTRDQLQALREIKSSDDVRLFLSKDGATYINVVVDSVLSTPFESDNNIHEFNLTIRLPQDFNFFDSKLY